ncbi:MAG: DinB family protein [Cyclobacteriaceae bacterium]
MKTLLISVVMIMFGTSSKSAGEMSEAQRDYLVDYLTDTEKNLFEKVKKLSADQWLYKPAEDVWSIAQICDHLMNAEESLTKRSRGLLEAPPQYDKQVDMDSRVEAVLNIISEKNRKTAKIPVAAGTEPMTTEVRWKTPKEFIKEFKALRDENIKFIRTTDKPLLAHYNPLIAQLGEMNSYLWTVFMAAHSARHTAQIEEVKGHDSYPN